MLQSLQSLRGIFAIMIFLHHFPVGGHGLFAAGGDCGVEFFIMLSGFVMSAGYGSRAADGSLDYRAYMRRRVARLYPLHLLCLVLFLLLYGWRIGRAAYLSLMPNILLLQSWIPVQQVYFSGNAVSWCLSDLMFFYAIFPFLAAFYRRARKCFISALIAVTGAYFALIGLLPERSETAIIYIFPPTRLLDFIFGMMLWHVYCALRHRTEAKERRSQTIAKSAAEIAVAGLTVAACLFFGDVTPRLSLVAYWWIPSAMTILLFALNEKNGGIISRLLQCRALVAFGNVSFSFYMLHVLVISSYKLLLSATGIHEQPWIALPALLAVTAGLSFLVYYRFEMPLGARLSPKR